MHVWREKRNPARWERVWLSWLGNVPSRESLHHLNSDVTLLTIINWSFNTSWINKWISWKNVAGEGRRRELQDRSALVCGDLGDASGESGLPLPGCTPNRKPALHTDTDSTNWLVFETWLVGSSFCHSFFAIPVCHESGNVAGTNRTGLHVGSLPLTFAFRSFCYSNHWKAAVYSCKHTSWPASGNLPLCPNVKFKCLYSAHRETFCPCRPWSLMLAKPGDTLQDEWPLYLLASSPSLFYIVTGIQTPMRRYSRSLVHHPLGLLTFQIKLLFLASKSLLPIIGLSCGDNRNLQRIN